MNKYERDQLKANLERLVETEISLDHLSLRMLYLHTTYEKVKKAREEIESVLRIVTETKQ